MEISSDEIDSSFQTKDAGDDSDDDSTLPLIISEEVESFIDGDSNSEIPPAPVEVESFLDGVSNSEVPPAPIDVEIPGSKKRSSPHTPVKHRSNGSGFPMASKRPRYDPTERKELLTRAVKDVIEQKISMRQASQRYDLAKSSLCDYVRKNGIQLPNMRTRTKTPDSSQKTTFSSTPTPSPSSKSLIIETSEVGNKLPTLTKGRVKPRAIAPKLIRIESPWKSTAGLPTQVPMSSWGVMGCNLTGTKLGPLILPKAEEASGMMSEFLIPLAPLNSPDADVASLSASQASTILKEEAMDSSLDAFTCNGYSPEEPSNWTKGLLNFINASPSPFHAVSSVRERLLKQGFRELEESEPWQLKPNDRATVMRGDTSLIVLAVGGQFKPGNGFTLISTHADSACIKVRPKAGERSEGYVQLGVECYGNGSWYTWLDRDLTVAGRCVVRKGNFIESRLVHIPRPILRIPNLAVHLGDHDGVPASTETNLAPLLCTAAKEELLGGSPEETKDSKYPSALLRLLASELNAEVDDILDLELCLTDTQPGKVGGIKNEFMFAPRLDNLFSIYAAVEGLVASLDSLETDPNLRVICIHDNGERGADFVPGVAPAFIESVLRRVGTSMVGQVDSPPGSSYEESLVKSVHVRGNQSHAVHPNYLDNPDNLGQPSVDGGLVLRRISMQNCAMAATVVKETARLCDVPLHDIIPQRNVPCCGTDPFLSSRLGLSMVDVGAPLLSMHSCREMASTNSITQAVTLYSGFYEHYPKLQSTMKFL